MPKEQDVDTTPAKRPAQKTLLTRIGERFGLGPNQVMNLLRKACPNFDKLNDEELVAALVIMDQHRLNPILKELYVIQTKGGLTTYVSVDGWNRIVLEHPGYEGSKTVTIDAPDREKFEKWLTENTLVRAPETVPYAMQTTIWRSDQEHPIEGPVEYYIDCYMASNAKGGGKQIVGPWDKVPARMIRHRSRMQSGRESFAFAGITDEWEAKAIIDAEFEIVGEEETGGVAGILEDLGRPSVDISDTDEKVAEPVEAAPECDPATGEVIPDEIGRDEGEGLSARTSGKGSMSAGIGKAKPGEL